MNIKSVRFPSPVAVVKGELHTEWMPGKRGVREIHVWSDTTLLFVMDGVGNLLAQILPGTVIAVDMPDTTGQTFVEAKVTATPLPPPADKAPDGHASSTPSKDPPPARPIPKSGRVQR